MTSTIALIVLIVVVYRAYCFSLWYRMAVTGVPMEKLAKPTPRGRAFIIETHNGRVLKLGFQVV